VTPRLATAASRQTPPSTPTAKKVDAPRKRKVFGLFDAMPEGVRVDAWGGTGARPAGASLGNGGATFPPTPDSDASTPVPDTPGTSPVIPEAPAFRPSSSVSRWGLLHRIQRLCRPDDPDERGPAVCGCGRPGFDVEQVAVHLRAGEQTGELRAGVSGVYRCGSPWLCPVCAVHKAKERAERVERVTEATYAQGGQVVLVVLTVSHGKGDSLADVKTLVQGSSRRARQGAPWRRLAERRGILGVVVGQEVTLSRRHGWHYHQHLSIPVYGPTDEEAARAVERGWDLDRIVKARALRAGRAVARRYREAAEVAGGTCSLRHGTHVRVADDATDAADYTAKGSLAWEVAGGVTKAETRADTSLTPWDVAERAYAGDGWARDRWTEYADVMPGTRSCVVSPSLAKALDLESTEEEDDEAGEQVLHEADEIVGRVATATWRRWLRHGLASTFLARVELGGEAGFGEAVERTDWDARVMEDRYEARDAARQAEREADRERRRRADVIAEAVCRVHAADGAGTRARVRRVIADIADGRPEAPPPAEADVIAALAAVPPERTELVRAVADILGGRIVDVGLAA
jgi:hypothetical protein